MATMRPRVARLAVALAAALGATLAAAQVAQNPGALVAQAHGTDLAASYWLEGLPDGQGATFALSVVYKPVPGGNATTIETAVWRVSPQGASLLGMVDGLFGLEPREPAFEGDAVELTTSMPRDGDPRCCPTGQVRWRIDLTTLQVTGRSAVF